jgi:hypothetical protein
VPAARVAQQQSVADPQREGVRQAQPDDGAVQGTQPGADRGRADVHHRLGREPVLRRPGQGHVHDLRGPEGPGRQQGVAPGQVLDRHSAQVQRHPRGRDRPVDRLAERLQPADHHVAFPHPQPVAGGDGPGGQRAGHHGAGAADGEGTVDPEPDGGGRVRCRKAGEQRLQRGHQVGHPLSRARADRDRGDVAHRRARQPLAGVGQHRGGVGQIRLGHGEQGVPHAERVEDGDVLGGLRRPAVVRRDHDQRRGHRSDTGQHVADEPLVPRDVDDREPAPRGQRRPGEAEVDGEPAAAFLGPAVGLHTGQRADEG